MVGLGWIAQTAVLPAFQNARRNSSLTALVSGDPVKLRTLGARYGVRQLHAYEELDRCLEVLRGREPEPSGEEGLADVRVLEAIERSAREGRPVRLAPFERRQRPGLEQERSLPLPHEPTPVHAQDPTPAG